MVIDDLIAKDERQPRRIAVVGDAIVDCWITGRTFPSQDGCSKFVESRRRSTFGGASNAVNCLSDWCIIVDLYAQEKCSVKTRYVEDGRIVFRHDADTVSAPYSKQLDFEHYSAVLLCDYDKGFLSTEFIRSTIDGCLNLGIPCIADVKRPPHLYEGAVCKGNMDYFTEYGNLDIVTDGRNAPYVHDVRVDSPKSNVTCINHVGAGDCFAAHLTLALAYGLPITEAARIAHSAGRVYVQHPFNRPPTRAEIRADFTGH